MIEASLLEIIEKKLQTKLNKSIRILSTRSVSGGCINNTFSIKTNNAGFFVKTNSSFFSKMFEKEAFALEYLKKNSPLRTPGVICYQENAENTFLVLEYIESAPQAKAFWENFAISLAKQHQCNHDYFGFEHWNYIGSVKQENTKEKNWTDFFILHRLEPLLKQAVEEALLNSVDISNFNRLFHKLEKLFPTEKPALLHGDLWGGNFMTDENGSAVIFDPAIYFGHREMDIAMTKLFGGFSPSFYSYYNDYFPLADDWEKRLNLCNLYPLLVHLILFGSSYSPTIRKNLSYFI
jgi:fructosamine-3-kinase